MDNVYIRTLSKRDKLHVSNRTTSRKFVGVTETLFKQSYSNYFKSFSHRNYEVDAELSK